MAVVKMIEAELVSVALFGVCVHLFRPWQLLPDLHQHLNFWSIERGVAVESSRGRALSNSAVRASPSMSSGRSSDMLVFGGSQECGRVSLGPFSAVGLLESPAYRSFVASSSFSLKAFSARA